MLGVLLTKWTIRLALACYVAYLAGWILCDHRHVPSNDVPHGTRWPRAARAIWTLGCALLVVHVGCAFHFYHHWSHAAAWSSTAQETEKLLGIPFGDGIYFSYLFLFTWVLDVTWLWLRRNRSVANGTPGEPATPNATAVPMPAILKFPTRIWRALVHGFLLFIAVNGAMVFEAGPTRWAGAGACLIGGVLIARRALERASVTNTNCPASASNQCTLQQEESDFTGVRSVAPRQNRPRRPAESYIPG